MSFCSLGERVVRRLMLICGQTRNCLFSKTGQFSAHCFFLLTKTINVYSNKEAPSFARKKTDGRRRTAADKLVRSVTGRSVGEKILNLKIFLVTFYTERLKVFDF
jgi:hypothetical protein